MLSFKIIIKMEFTKLTSASHDSMGDEEVRGSRVVHTNERLASEFGLIDHTEEDLKNIEYQPGLTREQLKEMGYDIDSFISQQDNDQTADSIVLYQKPKSSPQSATGHIHGHNCNHSHPHNHSHSHESKKGGKKFKNKLDDWKNVLRGLIYFIQTYHFLYVYLKISPLIEDPFYAWMMRVTYTLIYIFTLYSHLSTTTTPSLSFDRKKDKMFLSNNSEYKTCDRCNNIWKPERSHHCSVQKHDVLRMDHYCPVTLNTIGFKNHGTFLMTAMCHFVRLHPNI